MTDENKSERDRVRARLSGSIALWIALSFLALQGLPARAETGDPETEAKLRELYPRAGKDKLEGSAKKWWDEFERVNQSRLRLVLRVVEELVGRDATMSQFFEAYVWSGTDNILANLHYMDYRLGRYRDSEGWELGAEPGRAEGDLEALERQVGWDTATAIALAWWSELKSSHAQNPAFLRKVLRELKARSASIDDLFLAHVNGGAENMQATLYYLDYARFFKAGRSSTRDPLLAFGKPTDWIDYNSATRFFRPWDDGPTPFTLEERIRLVRGALDVLQRLDDAEDKVDDEDKIDNWVGQMQKQVEEHPGDPERLEVLALAVFLDGQAERAVQVAREALEAVASRQPGPRTDRLRERIEGSLGRYEAELARR